MDLRTEFAAAAVVSDCRKDLMFAVTVAGMETLVHHSSSAAMPLFVEVGN